MADNYHKVAPTAALCALMRGKYGGEDAQAIAKVLMTQYPDSLGDLRKHQGGFTGQEMSAAARDKLTVGTLLEGRALATDFILDEHVGRPRWEMAAGLSDRALRTYR
jgi:hypothetical protein